MHRHHVITAGGWLETPTVKFSHNNPDVRGETGLSNPPVRFSNRTLLYPHSLTFRRTEMSLCAQRLHFQETDAELWCDLSVGVGYYGEAGCLNGLHLSSAYLLLYHDSHLPIAHIHTAHNSFCLSHVIHTLTEQLVSGRPALPPEPQPRSFGSNHFSRAVRDCRVPLWGCWVLDFRTSVNTNQCALIT